MPAENMAILAAAAAVADFDIRVAVPETDIHTDRQTYRQTGK